MITLDIIRSHQHRANPALIDRGLTVSWPQWADVVAETTRRLACMLEGTASRRVAFLCHNSCDLATLQAAGATLGATVVGLDHSLPARTLGTVCGRFRTSVLVHDDELAGLAHDTVADVRSARLARLGDLVPASAAHDHRVPERLPGPFEAVGLTSGTSGVPKLVLRAASSDARRHRDMVDLLNLGAEDVYLNVVPLYHASGPGWAKVLLRLGATVVLARTEDIPGIVDLLEEHRPTGSLMVPPVLEAVVAEARARGMAFPEMRTLITGGRHVSARLASSTAAVFGDALRLYYGTTETGVNTLTEPGALLLDHTSAGRALPGNDIAIVDDDCRLLPSGKPGRVAVRSYMTADGYGDGTDRWHTIDDQAWWVTGDSGYLDDGGNLHVTARDAPSWAPGVDLVALESRILAALPVPDVALTWEDGVLVATCANVSDAGRAINSRLAPHVPGDVRIEVRERSRMPFSPTGKLRDSEQMTATNR